MTQPEALRLADEMESDGICMRAAAELRRLHAELTEWRVTVTNAERERDIAEEQRDALLEALKKARAEFDGLPRSLGYEFTHLPDIDAVIKKAEAA